MLRYVLYNDITVVSNFKSYHFFIFTFISSIMYTKTSFGFFFRVSFYEFCESN